MGEEIGIVLNRWRRKSRWRKRSSSWPRWKAKKRERSSSTRRFGLYGGFLKTVRVFTEMVDAGQELRRLSRAMSHCSEVLGGVIAAFLWRGASKRTCAAST